MIFLDETHPNAAFVLFLYTVLYSLIGYPSIFTLMHLVAKIDVNNETNDSNKYNRRPGSSGTQKILGCQHGCPDRLTRRSRYLG